MVLLYRASVLTAAQKMICWQETDVSMRRFVTHIKHTSTRSWLAAMIGNIGEGM